MSTIKSSTEKNILYLDCFSGISGDMFLGAMLDLGLDEKEFLAELKKLPLKDYEVEIKKSIKKGITGTDVTVITNEHHP
ncbi:MAG: nickel insertion protein, partial [Tepidanaerobacteraceae bacterium]